MQCTWDICVLPYLDFSIGMGTEGFELRERVATICTWYICITLPGLLYWYDYWRVWTPWTGSDYAVYMRYLCFTLPGPLHWYGYWRVWTPWKGSDSEQCIWDLYVLPYLDLSTGMGTEGFELHGWVATLGSVHEISVELGLHNGEEELELVVVAST